SANPTKTYRKA
ncbi:siderophore-mediated iron transport protein, partial [Helicobacter pylori]